MRIFILQSLFYFATLARFRATRSTPVVLGLRVCMYFVRYGDGSGSRIGKVPILERDKSDMSCFVDARGRKV